MKTKTNFPSKTHKKKNFSGPRCNCENNSVRFSYLCTKCVCKCSTYCKKSSVQVFNLLQEELCAYLHGVVRRGDSVPNRPACTCEGVLVTCKYQYLTLIYTYSPSMYAHTFARAKVRFPCMYAYVYSNICLQHVNLCVYIYTHTQTEGDCKVHARMFLYHAYAHIYMFSYTPKYNCVYGCTHTYMYTRTRTHTRTIKYRAT
jgi:hypothetical protein